MKYDKIALVMAMREEAMPIIEYFGLKKIDSGSMLKLQPLDIYSNEDESLILSLNGKSKEYGVDNIGSQAATLNSYIVISNFHPDLVINCGTSGGFASKNTNIGDVFIAKDKVIYHNRRISIPGGYTEYGIGSFPVMDSNKLAEIFDLKQGLISTGDAFDLSDADMATMTKNDVDIKEMEAAAVAWVCMLYNTDFTAIKSVTDFVDLPETTSELFLHNMELASNNLKTKIVDIVRYLTLSKEF